MSIANYPPISYVRQALREENGHLFWLVRPRTHFPTERGWKTVNTSHAGKEAGSVRKVSYANKYPHVDVFMAGVSIPRDHIVWAIHHGEWPSQIDHKNRDSLDDRIDNLRPATNNQNARNTSRRSNNTSGYKGVSLDCWTSRYKASIKVNGRTLNLGRFDTAAEAYVAYCKAAKKYYGVFWCDGTEYDSRLESPRIGITRAHLPIVQFSKSQYPSLEFLRQFLRYEDGRLFWLARPLGCFKDEQEWNIWNARYAGEEVGSERINKRTDRRIWQVRLNGKIFGRHRIVWALHHGDWPPLIDHKNRNPLDDRIENLRVATTSQNNANIGLISTNTSGYKGVYWNKRRRKFLARINVNYKRICLGSFDDPAEAHAAYVVAAKEHFGEFWCDGTSPLGV